MKSKGKRRKKKSVPKYDYGGIGLAGLVPGIVKSGIAKQNDVSGTGEPPEEKPGVLGLLGSALGPLTGILGSVGAGMFMDWKQRNDYQALEQQRYQQMVKDKTVTANNGIFEMGGGVDPKSLEGDIIAKILMNRNQNLSTVQRAVNPHKYPVINNPDGTVSTHKMGWEFFDNQAYMFPRILHNEETNSLYESDDPGEEVIRVPNNYANYISSKGYKNAAKDLSHSLGKMEQGGDPTKENKKPGKGNLIPEHVSNPWHFDEKRGVIEQMYRYSTPDSYPYDVGTPYQADEIMRILSNKRAIGPSGDAVKNPLSDTLLIQNLNTLGRKKYTGMNPPNLNFNIKKMEGGGNPKNKPTQQDSIDLYNNTKSLLDYYKNYMVIGKPSQAEKLGISVYDMDEAINNQYAYNVRKGNRRPLVPPGHRVPDKLKTTIDSNRYKTRETATGILDVRAPQQLRDKRIKPHTSMDLYNQIKGDPLREDMVEVYMYDPIKVKPYKLLTPSEKKIRDSGGGFFDTVKFSPMGKVPQFTGDKIRDKKEIPPFKFRPISGSDKFSTPEDAPEKLNVSYWDNGEHILRTDKFLDKFPEKKALGGFVQGKTYELTDAQIKKLKKQGFQLQYEED